jgi:hypothetical protein
VWVKKSNARQILLAAEQAFRTFLEQYIDATPSPRQAEDSINALRPVIDELAAALLAVENGRDDGTTILDWIQSYGTDLVKALLLSIERAVSRGSRPLSEELEALRRLALPFFDEYGPPHWANIRNAVVKNIESTPKSQRNYDQRSVAKFCRRKNPEQCADNLRYIFGENGDLPDIIGI